ncbi:MAG: serine/threonine protein kinase [Myxococcales bacterium FL481]|nr:MAG: serine/threonine protein kinase [Myxococcales bacterium FL481]
MSDQLEHKDVDGVVPSGATAPMNANGTPCAVKGGAAGPSAGTGSGAASEVASTMVRGPDASGCAGLGAQTGGASDLELPATRDEHDETDAGRHDLTPGTVLADRYRIVRRIGVGGMGEVYLAEHVGIERLVAVKLVGRNFVAREDLVERFEAEAKATSRVKHPNIVDITDFGRTDAGVPFFVMEFLDGEELVSLMEREGPLAWPRALAITKQCCQALEAAHRAGVIHRDVKPENCFLVRDASGREVVKLLDFGIAKTDRTPVDQSWTQMGVLLGTAAYMSPEQARGRTTDARSDLYSLGIILYEMLVGHAPFLGDDAIGVLTQHLRDAPPAFSDAAPELTLPVGLQQLVFRAIEKNPDDRYQSGEAFARAIAQFERAELPSEPVALPPALRDDPGRSGSRDGDQLEAEPRRGRRGLGLAIAILSVTAVVWAVALNTGGGSRETGATIAAAAAVPPNRLVRAAVPKATADGGGAQVTDTGAGTHDDPVPIPASDEPVRDLPTPGVDDTSRGGVRADAVAMDDPLTVVEPKPRAVGPAASDADEDDASRPDRVSRERSDRRDKRDKRDKRSKRRRRAKRDPAPTSKPAPANEVLDVHRQLAGIDLSSCRGKGALPGMKVKTSVSFDAAGRLDQVRVLKPLAGSALAACIVTAVERSRVRRMPDDAEGPLVHHFRLD